MVPGTSVGRAGVKGVGSLGDLPVSELRAQGQKLLAWIAEYLGHPERFRVLSPVRPGDIRAAVPAAPPASGE